MKKVLNMTEFVLEQQKLMNYRQELDERGILFNRCVQYAELLQTFLSLSMFIPCDDKGGPMERPVASMKAPLKIWIKKYQEQYQQAQEKVLFEGWELDEDRTEIILNYKAHDYYWNEGYLSHSELGDLQTIEELINSNIHLVSTPTLLKKIGLTDNKDKQD